MLAGGRAPKNDTRSKLERNRDSKLTLVCPHDKIPMMYGLWRTVYKAFKKKERIKNCTYLPNNTAQVKAEYARKKSSRGNFRGSSMAEMNDSMPANNNPASIYNS